jgi:hypothetical protein
MQVSAGEMSEWEHKKVSLKKKKKKETSEKKVDAMVGDI